MDQPDDYNFLAVAFVKAVLVLFCQAVSLASFKRVFSNAAQGRRYAFRACQTFKRFLQQANCLSGFGIAGNSFGNSMVYLLDVGEGCLELGGHRTPPKQRFLLDDTQEGSLLVTLLPLYQGV